MTPMTLASSLESQFIHALFHSLPGLAYAFDETGKFVYWNSGWQRLLGLSDQDMTERAALDLVVPRHRTRVEATIREVLAGKEVAIECSLLHGHYEFPVYGTGVLMNIDGRQLIVGQAIDMSAHFATEDALIHSERKYREVFNSTDDAMVIHRYDGRILDVNEAWCRLNRLDRQSAIGLNADQLPMAGHPYSAADAVQHVRLAVQEGPQVFEWLSMRTDGSTFWSEVSLRATEIAGDQRIIAVARDITERKLATEQSRMVERRLALALSATADSMWEWNVRSGVMYYSPRWYEMLGYEDQEFPMDEDTWSRLCHPDDLQEASQQIQRVLSEGRPPNFSSEFRMQRKDGTWAWILGRGGIIERDADGKVLVLMGTNTDVTERKQAESERQRLEESLRQAQKMESIGRLAGGVAHDFNNLLTAISGNLSLAMMRGVPDPELVELLTEAAQAADSAANVTRQLLAFSRKQVIRPKVLCLNDTISGLQKILQRLLGEDIDLSVSLKHDLGHVEIDEGQIEQVLINLAVNSRDAMLDGGKLNIETTEVMLDEAFRNQQGQLQPGPYVLLAITDNGEGMSTEVLSHLFEPFYTTKEVGKGTGLGLAMAYGTVRQNRGHIVIESELDRGTTVRLYFPRVETSAKPAQSESPATPAKAAESILVVEDEEQVRTLAVRILQRQGYRVRAFSNGDDALLALAQLDQPVDLLLTDVVMPAMNGRVLAERALQSRPNMRVLFTSGYGEEAIAHHGVLETGIDFIAKPYSVESLTSRVREVLDKSKSAPPSVPT